MNIKVFIPKHSSALCSLPEIDEKYGNAVIIIHVHRERAMWNVFDPLFGDQDCDGVGGNYCDTDKDSVVNGRGGVPAAAELALLVIIHNFKPSLLKRYGYGYDRKYDRNKRSIRLRRTPTSKKRAHHDETREEIFREKFEKDHIQTWSESHFHESEMYIAENIRESVEVATKLEDQLFLTILIMPSPSSMLHCPNMEPERIFTSSLVKLENLQIRLQSLNAYIATLGGGYFLCHFLSIAVCLARYQRQIAFQLNDFNLAMKCTINEAYNYIHAGMIENALTLIQETEDQTLKRIKSLNSGRGNREETIIISMCEAARWFAERVRDGMVVKHPDDKGHMYKPVKNDLQSSVNSATHDDYQRIRVVSNRTIISKKLE